MFYADATNLQPVHKTFFSKLTNELICHFLSILTDKIFASRKPLDTGESKTAVDLYLYFVSTRNSNIAEQLPSQIKGRKTRFADKRKWTRIDEKTKEGIPPSV